LVGLLKGVYVIESFSLCIIDGLRIISPRVSIGHVLGWGKWCFEHRLELFSELFDSIPRNVNVREFDRAVGKFNFLFNSKEPFLIVPEGLEADLPAEDVVIHGEDVEIQT
jgi:hypothetical protein